MTDSELGRVRESPLEPEPSLGLAPRLTPPQAPPPWCASHKHGAPLRDIPPCKPAPSLCDTRSSNVSHTWAHTLERAHASALVCTSGPPSCGTAAQSLSGISSPALSRTRSSTHSRILLSFGFHSRCSHTFVLFDVLIAFQSQPSLNDYLILVLLEVDQGLIVVWTLLRCHLPRFLNLATRRFPFQLFFVVFLCRDLFAFSQSLVQLSFHFLYFSMLLIFATLLSLPLFVSPLPF